MKERLFNYSLLIFAFSLPFAAHWSSKAFILVCASFLIQLNWKALTYKTLLPLIGFALYAMLNIGLVAQTVNLEYAREILPIAVFFFIYSTFDITEKLLREIVYAFALGVALVGLVNLGHLWFFKDVTTIIGSWSDDVFIDIHKIYYSVYLNLAFFLLLGIGRLKWWYLVPAGLFTFGFHFITGSRLGLALFAVLLLAYVLRFIFRGRFYHWAQIIIGFAPVVMMALLSFTTFQSVLATLDGDGSRVRNFNTNKEIVWQKPLFGHGLGTERAVMQHHRNKRSWEFKNAYHAHNQFFEFLIGGGLVYAVLMLFYPAKLLLSKPVSFVLVAFGIIVFYSFLVESILTRHHGVFLYGFFTFLLLSFQRGQVMAEKQ